MEATHVDFAPEEINSRIDHFRDNTKDVVKLEEEMKEAKKTIAELLREQDKRQDSIWHLGTETDGCVEWQRKRHRK